MYNEPSKGGITEEKSSLGFCIANYGVVKCEKTEDCSLQLHLPSLYSRLKKKDSFECKVCDKNCKSRAKSLLNQIRKSECLFNHLVFLKYALFSWSLAKGPPFGYEAWISGTFILLQTKLEHKKHLKNYPISPKNALKKTKALAFLRQLPLPFATPQTGEKAKNPSDVGDAACQDIRGGLKKEAAGLAIQKQILSHT